MVGEIKTMSSAYKIILTHAKEIKQPTFTLITLATISSIKIANNKGERTPSCLTPACRLNTLETRECHLTQLVDNANQVSNIDSSLFGNCLSISLINNAKWLTRSKALDKSKVHKFTVDRLPIKVSTTLLTE
jgi:hypothetical protein